MSAILHTSPEGYLEIEVSGVLRKFELDHLPLGPVGGQAGDLPTRLLIRLRNFNGWAASDDWSDLLFAASHGSALERIAIVGDPVWETEALMFMGAGVRKTLIRYFNDDDTAHAWLLDR